MRHDKNEIFALRKTGKSYREIQNHIKISRSTLCEWFRNEDWSRHIRRKNTDRQIRLSIEHLAKLNEGRRQQIQKSKEKTTIEAEQIFHEYKNDPLFVGGLMIYLGEGDKSNKSNRVGVANVDYFALKIFKKFLKKFCGIEDAEFRAWILCYPDHNQEACKEWWSSKLGIPKDQFYKTQVIQGRHKTNRLIYGVGNIIMTRSLLKVKILKWIELMSVYLTRA